MPQGRKDPKPSEASIVHPSEPAVHLYKGQATQNRTAQIQGEQLKKMIMKRLLFFFLT